MQPSRAEMYRRTVLDALAGGPLCESDIRAATGLSYTWLTYVLMSLLHSGAAQYLGRQRGRGAAWGYFWGLPVRDSGPDGVVSSGTDAQPQSSLGLGGQNGPPVPNSLPRTSVRGTGGGSND